MLISYGCSALRRSQDGVIAAASPAIRRQPTATAIRTARVLASRLIISPPSPLLQPPRNSWLPCRARPVHGHDARRSQCLYEALYRPYPAKIGSMAMSISFMALAWKVDIPSGRKLVLLALCDHANGQGECYPSVETIARKCSMGQRTVQQHVGELESAGILVRRFRKGRSTVYRIALHIFCGTAGFRASVCSIWHISPAGSARYPCRSCTQKHQ